MVKSNAITFYLAFKKNFDLILIGLIFILSLWVHFLYFPQNVYFAYDQARDSYTALDILKGDLKIIGPPSAASDSLFPGPLAYYFYAPIYFLFDKNPEALSAFLRVYNSLGIILVFLIGKIIFNRTVGLLAALLLAVSFEQSQFSLFMSHQPLATVTVLLFYLGLSLLIFKKDSHGWIISMLGLGLSIQFHYVYVLLLPMFLFTLVIFNKYLRPLNIRYLLLSLLTFLVTLSTFLLVELKFNFRVTSGLFLSAQTILGSEGGQGANLGYSLFILQRYIQDNLISKIELTNIILGVLVVIFLRLFILNKELRPKLIFLGLWLLGGLIPYILAKTPSYYYGASASVSLIIFISFIVYQLMSKFKILGLILIMMIIISNLSLIYQQNMIGPNSDIVIQPGMLVKQQKEVLDFIYSQADTKPFAVNALTIPLNVNTTWSYLFEWYGKGKYGYLPVWMGPVAAGFPGHLEVVDNREKMPAKRFTILEPAIGIREIDIENFLKEEGYFTKVIAEKKFGTITVQERTPY